MKKGTNLMRSTTHALYGETVSEFFARIVRTKNATGAWLCDTREDAQTQLLLLRTYARRKGVILTTRQLAAVPVDADRDTLQRVVVCDGYLDETEEKDR